MHSRHDLDLDAFKKFQEREWNSIADQLPSLSSTTMFAVTATAGERLLDAVHAGPEIRLLDVACGPGPWMASALARGVQITAIDLAERMIEEARKRHPSVDFRVGDGERLDFADATFDAVTCNFGIQMFARPERAMAEALRVLRPGGFYAFTTWCPRDRNDFFKLWRSSIEAHGDTNIDIPEGPPDFFYGTVAECEQILGELGFIDVSAQEIVLHLEFSDPARVLDIISTTDRTRAIVNAQRPEVRARIEAAIIAGARAYTHGGVIRVPMPMLLTCGRRQPRT